MKIFKITAFFGALILLATPSAFGQTQEDSTYQNYINQAWKELKKVDYSDSLQTAYAADFFQYYQQHPQTPTGRQAFRSALLMWGNTGNASMVDQAIAHLDNNSELWQYVPHPMGNAYVKDPNHSREAYIDFLKTKKQSLTDTTSKASFISSLLRYLTRQSNQKEQVVNLAQELVNLNASDWYVDYGLGIIYEMESLGLGQEAPAFTANTVSNEEISLSDYKGKYVILDFWATWCGPCIPEIETLKTLHSNYQEAELAIISIALEETSDSFLSFLKEKEIKWPQINQAKSWNDTIPEAYNVTGIPQKYVIGPKGTIVAKSLRGEKLITTVDSLLTQP